MSTEQSGHLKEQLRSKLSGQSDSDIADFAHIIDEVISNKLSTSDAIHTIQTNKQLLAILEELNGKSVSLENTLVSFGKENQIGDISIRDVAGRDIINIGPIVIIPQTGTTPIKTLSFRIVFLLVLILLVLAAIVYIPNRTFPIETNCRLAFVAQRDGNPEIYSSTYNGETQVNLTRSQYDDWMPVWSPDGKHLAFMSQRDGNDEIYTLNTFTGEISRVTEARGDDGWPTWAPNNQIIAYTYDPDPTETEYVRDIYIIKADGTNRKNLTNTPNIDEMAPSWSPDGTKIAVHTTRNNNYEIVILDANTGAELAQLTNNTFEDSFPSWSPDGQSLAFASDRTGAHEIYILNLASRTERQISNLKQYSSNPEWSADGNSIAFHSAPYGKLREAEILIISNDGLEISRLIKNNTTDSDPDWSSNCE